MGSQGLNTAEHSSEISEIEIIEIEIEIIEMAAEVIQTLRGKVLTKNDRKVEYGDSIEPWSPFNADLHMQGIKVMVKDPVPRKIQKGDAFEDTMLLLEMMKEKKQREKKQQKEDLIRANGEEEEDEQSIKQPIFEADFLKCSNS